MPNYYVAFWNVENLFDVVNSPRRTDKLRRVLDGELTGWSASVLNRKVQQLASIIRQMNQDRGPDILGVCEVENDYVLRLLVDNLNIAGRNYNIEHHDMSDRRGIDVAFIYDQNFFTVEGQFSHFIVKSTATRDLFQVNFRTISNNLLILIGNHWPSRRGSQYETEPFRIIAGETLAYFHQRIREVQGNDVAVIAMGDFNDEPFNRSIVKHALCEKIRAKITKAKSPKFLNLMWPLLGDGIGTYYHDNNPNMLDQFLVSKGLLTGNSNILVRQDSAQIVRFPQMVNSGTYPTPKKYGRGSSLDRNGFSDHFPIALQLSE
ncbi:MAG TPA: endonuclease/exonuclease/phosphatase family protein [Candidatus Brocadiia bacterium]|nr:endonuclease/exonuclease/phosphatase family protein [Planctomycetota bacterium]MDO8093150.1 endonuclease/exonuclease/phosphatase family protein [Candidatus Brocadiales bacterium]